MIIFLLLAGEINLDISQFSLSSDKTYCEVYYSLPTGKLDFKEKGGRFSATLSMILGVKNETSNKTFLDTLQKIVTVSDTTSGGRYFDTQPIILSSANRFRIDLKTQPIRGSVWEASTTFVARKWNGEFKLSDIQVSHTLIPTTENNRFVKNGFKLIPYPSRKFNKNRYLLTSYCEVYGAVRDLILLTYLIEGQANGIDTLFNDYSPTSDDVMAIPMVFNLLGYNPGSYTLKLIARSGSDEAVATKDFWIEGAPWNVPPSIPDSIMEYASFIRYIASPEEVSQMNTLTGKAKELFLLRFWSKRDPNPATKENEALNFFMKRVKYADSHFSVGGTQRQGRITDMGRAYIKYGQPDDIIRRTAELEVDPYIIWHYFAQDEWFIFMNRDMTGEYKTIYSTVEGEPIITGWMSLILPEDRSRITASNF
ncbi:MAG: GWxTD domain-containing protein [candidate division WOR-3 bacterium]|nr:GWxTD domain-containing protein [candidate division WOR-3 bacterium]